MTRLSLRLKLLLTSLGLAVIPVAIIGIVFYLQFISFGDQTGGIFYDALVEETEEVLQEGVGSCWEETHSLIQKTEEYAQRLASSPNTVGYVTSKLGKNALINGFLQREIVRITEGLLNTCVAQHSLLQKKVDSDLNVAWRIFSEKGAVTLLEREETWNAVNQFTKAQQEIALPVCRIGESEIRPVRSFEKSAPVVDEVKQLVGGTCTLFQRMNSAGDMLRVATNVEKQDGTRAVGTYIPAVQPDGVPNAVVDTVLRGKVYRGRAYVVNAWYITAYRPVYDVAKKVVGMLYVGVKEQDSPELTNAILGTRIGKSGYVFVMDAQGNTILHPNEKYIGTNVIRDMKLTSFQEILDNPDRATTNVHNYTFQNRPKCLVYRYFPQWDWFICATAYWDDLAVESQLSEGYLREEIASMYNGAMAEIADEKHPLYAQIRFLDRDGLEVVKLQSGKFSDKLLNKSDTSWFREASRLKAGQVYNGGVKTAQNTGQPEVRMAAPIYFEDEFQGLFVLNLNWGLIWKKLAHRVYGETGYPYILDERGVVVSHPQYTIEDNLNITDEKYGPLATLTRTRMLAGEKGVAQYTFEGITKFAAFRPFPMGKRSYVIATTVPADEALVAANQTAEYTQQKTKTTIKLLLLCCLLVCLISGAIGLTLSNSIAKPLKQIIELLDGTAFHVNAASNQLASSSQDMAHGATEQASALQETASSLQEMAGMTKKNAEHAFSANDISQSAQSQVTEGLAAMKRMNTAIERIKSSSDETVKILRTIDEIAFQTNLLALNAAVEAARAGDAGKGFAVVAEEVRNLAQRCGEAAKNTASLLEEAQQNAEHGVHVAEEVDGVLESITQNVQHIGGLIDNISSASKEQSHGIEQINKAVYEIEQVTQHNSAYLEESASASVTLSEQATELSDMVSSLSTLVRGQQQNGHAKQLEQKGLPQKEARNMLPGPQ